MKALETLKAWLRCFVERSGVVVGRTAIEELIKELETYDLNRVEKEAAQNRAIKDLESLAAERVHLIRTYQDHFIHESVLFNAHDLIKDKREALKKAERELKALKDQQKEFTGRIENQRQTIEKAWAANAELKKQLDQALMHKPVERAQVGYGPEYVQGLKDQIEHLNVQLAAANKLIRRYRSENCPGAVRQVDAKYRPSQENRPVVYRKIRGMGPTYAIYGTSSICYADKLEQIISDKCKEINAAWDVCEKRRCSEEAQKARITNLETQLAQAEINVMAWANGKGCEVLEDRLAARDALLSRYERFFKKLGISLNNVE